MLERLDLKISDLLILIPVLILFGFCMYGVYICFLESITKYGFYTTVFMWLMALCLATGIMIKMGGN